MLILGETPYSCNLCGKTFAFQQSFHKHMLYHTDEKPYTCTWKDCGKAFKELSTLQNHERIHSGERPFVCETCNKSFRQRVSYLVHRRWALPTCRCQKILNSKMICKFEFSLKFKAWMKPRIHTGVLPYTCTACGKKFRYKVQTVILHQIQCHALLCDQVTQRTHRCRGSGLEDQEGLGGQDERIDQHRQDQVVITWDFLGGWLVSLD